MSLSIYTFPACSIYEQKEGILSMHIFICDDDRIFADKFAELVK